MSKPSPFPAIEGLLAHGGPSGIPRRIVAVIVNAIKAEMRSGAVTNVSQKSRKIMPPSFANRYSTATISGVALVSSSITAVYHSAPDHVFRYLFTSSGGPMFKLRMIANV